MNGQVTEDIGETWRKRLLDGVRFIPDRGLPGTLEVFGDTARPILMSTLSAPWLAAAEYGKGRVIVMAHAAYMAKFEVSDQDRDLARLHLNVKLWLTRGGYRDQSQIGQLENEKVNIRDKLILIMRFRTPYTKPDDTILNFIRRGGSLVHAMCPWGWLELHPGKSLSDMPYANVLEAVGIAYQRSHWFLPKIGFEVMGFIATGIINTRSKSKRASSRNDHRISIDSMLDGSEGSEWKRELLSGVRSLPNIAAPGYLCAYGEQAYPILTSNHETGIWVAAAELGKGRIVAMAHNAFVRNLESEDEHPSVNKLVSNMRQWLTRGTYQDSSDIGCLQRGTYNLKTNKILIVRGRSQFKIPDEDLIKFIVNGGSLVHAFCSWTWLLSHPGRYPWQIPYADVLDKAGISYLDGNWLIPETGFRMSKNIASDNHHIRIALGNITNEIASKTLLLLNYLPRNTILRILDEARYEVEYFTQNLTVHYVPTVHTPVFSNEGRAMMGLTLALAKVGRNKDKIQLQGLEEFPGNFEVKPNKFKMKVDIVSQFEDVYPTGCYLRAGDDAIVTIQTEDSLKYGWKLQIGCHSDQLHTENSHVRWPNVIDTYTIDRRRFKITSLFGGLIYFVSPEKKSAMEAVLSNVVEAPFFDLTNRARVEGWKDRRYAPGLWADICGEFIRITLPSTSVRHIDDLTQVMGAWDEVVRANHHLRGSNIHKYRKQWIVTDIQPVGGVMHSGYPIIATIDFSNPTSKSFLLNYNQVVDGGLWNIFAEIGHNMQKTAWTFKGTENVTNNIFTLYVYDVVCRIGPWMPEWLLTRIKNVKRFLDKNEGFFDWLADPVLALFIYAQLANHFGWGLYKAVFRKYRLLNSEAIPLHNVSKIDFWITNLSEVAGHNLAPLCDFWRIPLSTAVRNRLTQYPPFLPHDEVTTLAPSRMDEILEYYHDVVMSPDTKVVDEFKDDNEPPRFQQPAVMTHIMRS